MFPRWMSFFFLFNCPAQNQQYNVEWKQQEQTSLSFLVLRQKCPFKIFSKPFCISTPLSITLMYSALFESSMTGSSSRQDNVRYPSTSLQNFSVVSCLYTKVFSIKLPYGLLKNNSSYISIMDFVKYRVPQKGEHIRDTFYSSDELCAP